MSKEPVKEPLRATHSSPLAIGLLLTYYAGADAMLEVVTRSQSARNINAKFLELGLIEPETRNNKPVYKLTAKGVQLYDTVRLSMRMGMDIALMDKHNIKIDMTKVRTDA